MAKLALKRQGPFKIIKQILPVAYQLQLPRGWTIHDIFHASLLHPYKETSQHGSNFTKPPAEIINGKEEFEVKDIINHWRYGPKKQLQYLIKWKGYPSCDNSWEPAESIHAPDLLRKYHARHPINDTSRRDKRRPPNL